MFDTILIANRGEIACRVIDTCRRMGVRSVAVFSDADAGARHVQMADLALHIGPAQASESYLNIARIVAAARESGAQAIHPGYGFLSENADFADACVAADIVLIGPPASAMRAMGSKAAAKTLMGAAGVPLVPGYHGDAQDAATLTAAAEAIGFPVLIKASAGGGGRGMRIVAEARALAPAIEGAAREARAAFGDDRLLIEKYLTRPRHIEIQVFADTLGNTVSLFERDCSIQRRHQKVVEEAPAPGMDPERRRAMGEAAIAAARAVGYVGAGTVEFIAEADAFFFMEMNTRLQVEHPVTELVTGQDLVEWQLRVAAGERLVLLQHELGVTGHAIEVRVYAEDPRRDFLPSVGRLLHLRQPIASQHVRVDTGVREGDTISPYYDAMIAKLIVSGTDRATALRHLRTALAAYEIVGVRTNLALLRGIAASAEFSAGGVDTGFIGRHPELLDDDSRTVPDHVIAAAALAACDARRQHVSAGSSPWGAADSWRLNLAGHENIVLSHDGENIAVRLHPLAKGSWRLDLPSGAVEVGTSGDLNGPLRITLRSREQRVHIVELPSGIAVVANGETYSFIVVDPLAAPEAADTGGGKLTAPIPARVARVLVAAGDTVARGAALVVLEAMKMEITVSAPRDGIIASVRYAAGDMVTEGAELAVFE